MYSVSQLLFEREQECERAKKSFCKTYVLFPSRYQCFSRFKLHCVYLYKYLNSKFKLNNAIMKFVTAKLIKQTY